MLRKVLLCLTVFAAVFCFVQDDAQAQVAPEEAEAAIRYHFDSDEEDFAVAVAACETNLGTDIYNESSGAYGILQMLPSTAYDMGYDYASLDDPYYSAWAAKDLHDYMESLGYWGFQPWECAY